MTAPLRPASLVLAAGLAALTAGCHRQGYAWGGRGDRPLAVTTRLECPDAQGDLRRTDRAADGRSCRYAGPDGQEVTLAYLALSGRSPQDALSATEADLRAQVPAAAAPEPGSLRSADEDRVDRDGQGDGDDRDDDADRDSARGGRPTPNAPTPGPPTPPKPPEPPQVDARGSADRGGGDEGGRHDRVHINLPFLHVDADGDGRARVRTFGVDVDANDGGAMIRTPGGGSINARHDGAEMRFGSVGRRRADLVYIVASDRAGPQGFRSGAYVAKGPAAGPLVLAVTRSRHDSEGPHDGDLRDLKRLVNHNVRGARGFDFDID